MRDVIEASREVPVLVDFWAPWCGPCRQLTPMLEKAVRAAKGAVKLVKLNIDEHPQIPTQMGVQSIPAVFAFSDGQPIDGFMGALPESARQGVHRAADRARRPMTRRRSSRPPRPRSRPATQQRRRRSSARCCRRTRRTRKPRRGSPSATSRAATCARAEQTLALVPPAKARVAPRRQRARRARPCQRKPPMPATWTALSAKVAADPNDHQARFDLALALNARATRGRARRSCSTIVRKDRDWNDEAARKQLCKCSRPGEPSDPSHARGPAQLSSLLFA